MVLEPDGEGGFRASGGKYYIGNGNLAGMVSVFGRRADMEGPDGYVFFAADSQHPNYKLVRNVVNSQNYVSEFEWDGGILQIRLDGANPDVWIHRAEAHRLLCDFERAGADYTAVTGTFARSSNGGFFVSYAEPGENCKEGDLIDFLMNAEMGGEKLTGDHIGGTIALLLIAGIDTTWSAIGASLWHLAQHPEDRQRLIQDPVHGVIQVQPDDRDGRRNHRRRRAYRPARGQRPDAPTSISGRSITQRFFGNAAAATWPSGWLASPTASRRRRPGLAQRGSAPLARRASRGMRDRPAPP